MIALSFDIEEFDMPLEYGKSIAFDEQMAISIAGTELILALLAKHQIKATFFTTAHFADHAQALVKGIVAAGHELASHSYYHSEFKVEHLLASRLRLEAISGSEVIGYRMPRMQAVDEREICKAGYRYNSSINPTFLPGRYNNLHKPRTHFMQDGVWQLPASVSPWIRFPLFWLSFHNLPLMVYQYLSQATLAKDKYLNVYFHPWEFTDLNQPERFNFPAYVSKNSGPQMLQRMDAFISWAKNKQYAFTTLQSLIATF